MSPVEVAEKYVELSRKTGRTTHLVMSLPNERCAILSRDDETSQQVKKLIQKLRPEYNIENVLFLTYQQNSGWRNHTVGRDIHMFVDNSVLDDMVVGQVKGINDVYGKRVNV